MEMIHRFSHRLSSISIVEKCFKNSINKQFVRNPNLGTRLNHEKSFKSRVSDLKPAFNRNLITIKTFSTSSSSSSSTARAGWFLGLGENKKPILPEIVKAGDPVLHEPSRDVPIDEIGSEKIQNIIDNMIKVMREAPGVGLAAPQIGIPLKIIVLEDTKEYISYAPKQETKEQDRHAFDLLVILNPKLKKKSGKTALFFEGCLSVDGFRAVVERHLEVEVTGLGRDGKPVKVEATGWQARILQHECDHLDGTIYVDKMVPRTFRTVENLDLPLPLGVPKLGVIRS
ncbi:Formylmethionine deformylase [Macleaya cordata]|uniref:Peptide deformylase n=1 Tax=Macleaya cordata TaxID=56857 RepID=A0A200PQG9_MACCD|nr:Formylmethionine deformylase [Macleaya cordata]